MASSDHVVGAVSLGETVGTAGWVGAAVQGHPSCGAVRPAEETACWSVTGPHQAMQKQAPGSGETYTSRKLLLYLQCNR